MDTAQSEGPTPSEIVEARLPIRPRPVLDRRTLFDHKDAAALTGLTVRTLQVYVSFRRNGRYNGPKPTKVPGEVKVYYLAEDLLAYLEHGHTGAPGDPNGGALLSEGA